MTTTETPTSRTSTSQSTANNRDALASLRIDRSTTRREPKRGRKWILAGLLLIIPVGGFFGFNYLAKNDFGLSDKLSGSQWVPEMMQQRVDVRLETVTVQRGRAADAVVVATGYVGSRRQARIGARAAGRINVISFEEGDRVKSGDLLAELDHKDLDASLAAAKATVSRAKASLSEQDIIVAKTKQEKARYDLLFKSRSVSESEYNENRFAYESAVARAASLEAELALAEAQMQQSETLLENMFIRAPFDGTVISKDAEEGESIMPGGMGGTSGRGSVATIADLDNLEIECDVQEDFISRVSESQQADISVDAVPNKKYHGQVRKIIPMGDRARATIKVKVAISDADDLLFPEMSGTVYFLPTATDAEINDEPRYFCPATSVTSDDAEKQFVWLVDGEKRAYKQAVTTGEQRDGKVEILSGLTERERIVVNPENLQEGMPVKVAE